MGVLMIPVERTSAVLAPEMRRRLSQAAEAVHGVTDVASLIGNSLECNACSIYLIDPASQQLVLSGTVGLRQDCVGKIQMSFDEGLTGLVAQEKRPVVVLHHASSHPRFRYFPEAGEDLYESFLGVPIVDRASVIGVLVAQTFELAKFSHADIQRLTEAGRTLGPIVAPLRRQIISQLQEQAVDV